MKNPHVIASIQLTYRALACTLTLTLYKLHKMTSMNHNHEALVLTDKKTLTLFALLSRMGIAALAG